MEEPKENAEGKPEPILNEAVEKLPDHIRKIIITYNIITNKIDVRGTVLDKMTAFQMLLEAGHIIIGIPVPVPGKAPTNGNAP